MEPSGDQRWICILRSDNSWIMYTIHTALHLHSDSLHDNQDIFATTHVAIKGHHLQLRLSRRAVPQRDGPLYLEFPIEFVTVAIQHSQVQWTKVWIKISVHELVIYAEIVGVWRGLWSDGHLQSSEIELICKEEKRCWWCWNSIHRQSDHF
jgi:hypothetical protein